MQQSINNKRGRGRPIKKNKSKIERLLCYCGRAAGSFMKTIKCSCCSNWFHEKCVKSLQYPMYCGDR